MQAILSNAEPLSERICRLLQQNASLDCYAAALKEFRTHGGERAAARKVLNRLRNDLRFQQDEDRILEILDIVEGFVAPHLQVWKEE